MAAGLTLMENVLRPLTKSVLTPSRLTGAASATDAAIQNNIIGSGTTALIISNEKMEDEAYIINLDKYESIGTHWIVLHVNAKNETYFDSFGVENIPPKIRKLEILEIKIL